MKYSVAAILSLGVVPAVSLSYLDSISSGARAPSSASPAASAEPPFFFTNGARDEPAGTPDFFFTNGPPSGAGMASYLDSLPKSAPPSRPGAGLASYVDALSGGAKPAAYAPAPAAPAPAAPAPASSSAPIAPGNYMESLVATSGAPTGAGMTTYLDALPRAPAARGGAGIASYTDALPISNTFAGTGAGMSTYTDNLSGGRSTGGKTFSPFSSKSPARPSFGMGSTGKFEFEIQVNANMLAQIEAARGRTVRLSGKATLN